MARTEEQKIAKAKERITAAGEDTIALRKAKKAVKRAQRRTRTEAAVEAKRADMVTRQEANVAKAAEKVAKKKAAEESALNAAAEKAAEAAEAAKAPEASEAPAEEAAGE